MNRGKNTLIALLLILGSVAAYDALEPSPSSVVYPVTTPPVARPVPVAHAITPPRTTTTTRTGPSPTHVTTIPPLDMSGFYALRDWTPPAYHSTYAPTPPAPTPSCIPAPDAPTYIAGGNVPNFCH